MAETAENASPTDKKLSKSLQFELALLWRTLDMIRNIDEDAVVAFYDSLVVSLRSVPALSLSSYWDKKHGTHTSIVGVVRARDEVAHVAKSLIVDPVDDSANGDVAVVGAGHSSSENGAFAVDIKLPELEYLTEDGRAHDEHDPLGLVRNLFYTAATHLARATSAKHINTLLNSLLTIAIKSGRASLLLYICILIANAGGDAIELDMNLLVELNDVIESKQDGEHSGKDEFTNEKLSSILFYSSTANVSDNCEKVGGILLSFGKADHGKLGHGDMQLHRLIPTVVEALVDVDVVKMASMSTYALALDSHGSVYVWGTGGSAGSSHGLRTDIQPQLLDALPSGCLVADISCGLGHALFLVRTGSGGRVYSWGNGGNGRLGLGDATDRTEAVLVNRHVENEDVVSVQCGASHSMVLTKQGKVYCWGKNTQGQCGVGATTDVLIPTLVKKLENSKVTVLAAGWEHSLVLTDAGNLYSWGCGYKDSRRGVIPPVLGLGHNECRTSPELISSIETVKIVDVICGWDHCLALDEKGKVLSWGSGQNGKLGHGNEENIAVPCYIPVFEQMKEKVTYLAAGCEHSAAITSSGQLFTWGHGDGGRLGQGTGMASFMPGNVEAITIMGGRAVKMHCGDKFSMVVFRPKVWDDHKKLGDIKKNNSAAKAENVLSSISQVKLFAEVAKDFLKNPSTIEDLRVQNCFQNGQLFSVLDASARHSHVDSNLKNSNDDVSHVLSNDPATSRLENIRLSRFSKSHVQTLLLHIMAKASTLADQALRPNGLDCHQLADQSLFLKPENLHTSQFQADHEYSVECSDVTFSSLANILEQQLHRYRICLEDYEESRFGVHESFSKAINLGESMNSEISEIPLDASIRVKPVLTSENQLQLAFFDLFFLLEILAANLQSLISFGEKETYRIGTGKSYSEDERQLGPGFDAGNDYRDADSEDYRSHSDSHGGSTESSTSAYLAEHENELGMTGGTVLTAVLAGYTEDTVGDEDNSKIAPASNPTRIIHRCDIAEDEEKSENSHLRCSDESPHPNEDVCDVQEARYSKRSDANGALVGKDHDRILHEQSFDSYVSQDFQENDASVNDEGNYGRRGPVSPAPSYGSMEQSSVDEQKKIAADAILGYYSSHSSRSSSDCYSPDGVLLRSSDGIDGDEDLEMQQAIISSIREGDAFIQPFDSDYLYRQTAKPSCSLDSSRMFSEFNEHITISIPKIRDLINATASSTYDFIGPFSLRKDDHAVSDRSHEALESAFILWKSSQTLSLRGFHALYSSSDEISVLSQLVHCPTAVLYSVPGLVKGLLLSRNRESTFAAIDFCAVLGRRLLPIVSTTTSSEATVTVEDCIELLRAISANTVGQTQIYLRGFSEALPSMTAKSIINIQLTTGSMVNKALMELWQEVLKALFMSFLKTPEETDEHDCARNLSSIFEEMLNCIQVDMDFFLSIVHGDSSMSLLELLLEHSFTCSVLQFWMDLVIQAWDLRVGMLLYPFIGRLLECSSTFSKLPTAMKEKALMIESSMNNSFSKVCSVASLLFSLITKPPSVPLLNHTEISLVQLNCLEFWVSSESIADAVRSEPPLVDWQYRVWASFGSGDKEIKQANIGNDLPLYYSEPSNKFTQSLLLLDALCADLFSAVSPKLASWEYWLQSLLPLELRSKEITEFLKKNLILLIQPLSRGQCEVAARNDYFQDGLCVRDNQAAISLRFNAFSIFLIAQVDSNSVRKLKSALLNALKGIPKNSAEVLSSLQEDEASTAEAVLSCWISSLLLALFMVCFLSRCNHLRKGATLLIYSRKLQELLPVAAAKIVGKMPTVAITIAKNVLSSFLDQTKPMNGQSLELMVFEQLRELSFSFWKSSLYFGTLDCGNEFVYSRLGTRSYLRYHFARDRKLVNVISCLVCRLLSIVLSKYSINDFLVSLQHSLNLRQNVCAGVKLLREALRNVKANFRLARVFLEKVGQIVGDFETYGDARALTSNLQTELLVEESIEKSDFFVTVNNMTLKELTDLDLTLANYLEVLMSEEVSNLMEDSKRSRIFSVASHMTNIVRLCHSICNRTYPSFSATLSAVGHYLTFIEHNLQGDLDLNLTDIVSKNAALKTIMPANSITVSKISEEEMLAANLAELVQLYNIHVDSRKRSVGYERSYFNSDKTMIRAFGTLVASIQQTLLEKLTVFQRHLIYCHSFGGYYLHMNSQYLESQSPSIVPSVFTPQGSYCVGFWLYLPSANILRSTYNSEINDDETKIHLISRVSETGDIPYVSLLDCSNDLLDRQSHQSLSVQLVLANDGGVTILVDLVVQDFHGLELAQINTSLLARKKAIRTATLSSKPLECGRWISVFLEVQATASSQEEELFTPEGEIIAHEHLLNKKDHDLSNTDDTKALLFSDCTRAVLYIDRSLEDKKFLRGGKAMLHQNFIIGKIPSMLGCQTPASQITLTDIFWIPSNITFPGATPEGCRVKSFLESFNSSSGQSLTDSALQGLLPQLPPSEFLLAIESLLRCVEASMFMIAALIAEIKSSLDNNYSDSFPTVVDFQEDINKIASLATELLPLSNESAQEASLQMLHTLLSIFTCLKSDKSVSETDATNSRDGSTVINTALNDRATFPANFLQNIVALVSDMVGVVSSDRNNWYLPEFLHHSASNTAPFKNVWKNRIKLHRLGVEKTMKVSSWTKNIALHENTIVTGVAGLTAHILECGCLDSNTFLSVINSNKLTGRYLKDMCPLILLACLGGWIPTSSIHRKVEVLPRKLFLFNDPKGLDQVAFPSVAVMSYRSVGKKLAAHDGKLSLAVCQLDGALVRSNEDIPSTLLLPERNYNLKFSATEIIPAKDPFCYLDVEHGLKELLHVELLNSDGLVDLLRDVVLPLGTRSLGLNELANSTKKIKGDSKVSSEFTPDFPSEIIEFASVMTFMRTLLVQLTKATSTVARDQRQQLSELLQKHIPTISSIASIDPVQAVTKALSGGTFKGVQMDVLKNLLKEGDVSFLEKISLRLWKQFKVESSIQSIVSRLNPANRGFVDGSSSSLPILQLAALAGEVIIQETKVRALSHFPSIRLLGVALERMTGRWFYECTLLSDGLIQIGWANALFRSDPVCGQGVGDHSHSWAYDGLRMKKWNVSCESYGRRWKLGDTVGLLIDTDLLEIKFFLNGEDLGVAFQDYGPHDIFPALSLNVRQCVRLNFGQYKFQFPPDKLDCKPFRAVVEALLPQMKPEEAKLPLEVKTIPLPLAKDSLPSAECESKDSTLILESTNGDTATRPLSAVERNQRPGSSSANATGAIREQRVTMGLVRNMNRTSGAVPAIDGIASQGADIVETSNEDCRPLSVRRSSNNLAEELHQEVMIRTSSTANTSDARLVSTGILQATLGNIQSTEVEEVGGVDPIPNNNSAVLNAINNIEQRASTTSASNFSEQNAGYEDRIADETDDRGEEDDEDDDEEDEDDDAEEDEDNGDRQDDHLVELRRQAMIESLIGMGFPVDWALRAAEHCDVSTSESAAISWIIERMELEQSKMDEIEGDSSSRAGDEDFEDAEDVGLEYFMQRHAAAFGLGNSAESAVADSTNTSSAAERYASGLRNALGRGGFTAEHLLELAGGFGSTGSPSRDEIYAARTGAGVRGFSVRGTVEEGGAALSNASKLGNRSHAVRSNDLNRNISTNALTDLGLDETKSSCTWNADLMYPSVLIGQYTSRRRHDIDKQEVLSQVSELELQDMLPIIASCEFALCVYYARAILVRGMSTFLEVGGDGENSYRTSVELEIESKNAALLGTCSAGSTFLEYLVSCGSAMTLKLLKCLFKQSVLVSSQSDRILPWIVNGNVAGDPRDRVPPFSPFQNTSVSCLSIILSKLELRLFSGSLSTMATEESSLQSTSALSAYIKSLLDLLECSSSVSDTAVENSGTSPYRLSSSMSELQGQALRAVGFEIEMPSRQSNMLSSVRKTLWFLVENALSDLERASSTKYDTCDWIYHGIDKEECVDDLFPIMVSNGDTAVVKDSPCVLLSYWFIRSLLILSKVQKETEVDIKLRDNYQKFREEFASSIAHDELLKGNPIAMLTSADTLSRLLKVSMCQNLTLRYCVWDLCSWILFRVNVILTVAMHQIPNRFPEFSQTSGGLSASNSDLQVPQLIAVEYYIAIAKEKRQLQIFGTRMKTELIDRKLLSRYTRATSMFLFQWQVLRRRLGLCSHNYVDDYLTSCSRYYNIDEYKKIVQGELEKSTITGADNSSCEYIRITQISPSSITVSWMLRPARDGELSKDDSSLYFTAASHVGLESPILVLSNLDRVGTFRIDDLESDTLYKVTITEEKLSAESSEKDVDEEDEDLGELVSPSTLPATQSPLTTGIDISVGGDEYSKEHNRNGKSENVVGDDELYIQASDISAAGEEAGGISHTSVAYTPSFIQESHGEEQPVGQGDKSQADLCTSEQENGGTVNLSSPISRQAKRLENGSTESPPILTSNHLDSVGRVVKGGKQEDLSTFAATEAESPFRFENESVSPNLVTTSNPLTVRNSCNKKWSTARASARMSSGIHRWDVHIDRCISKNIFIGVATREARLDNYVGCDRFGWAFLANKAVWHSKSKTKAYGDLFRTNDTVTVVLDLDIGTLSYCLNGKPLGVAVEGLVGPLYPAFSLYNEDDQLTVVQIKTTGDSSYGYGSYAAEMVLDRLEAVDCMMGYLLGPQGLPTVTSETTAATGKVSSLCRAVVKSVVNMDLVKELLQRWNHWQQDIGMRSVMVGSDFVTIVMSTESCAAISEGKLSVGDSLILEQSSVKVLGTACHRIWCQNQHTDELIGLTTDTIQYLFYTGGLRMAKTTITNLMPTKVKDNNNGLGRINQMAAIVASTATEAKRFDTNFSFAQSPVQFIEELVSLWQVWDGADDRLLVKLLHILARRQQTDPFSVNLQLVTCYIHWLKDTRISDEGKHAETLEQSRQNKNKGSEYGFDDENSLSGDIFRLIHKYQAQHMVLRILLLIHYNDLLLPLLPIVSPYYSSYTRNYGCYSNRGGWRVDQEDSSDRAESWQNLLNGEAPPNHPTGKLLRTNHIIFPLVKSEFAIRLASTNVQLSSIYISPDQSTLSLAESSGNVSNEASKPCIADGVFKSVSKDVVDGEAKVLDTDSKINDTTAVSDHVAASNVKRSILEYLASAKVLPSTFHTLACEDSNNASVGEVDKPLPAENNVSSTTTSPSQPKAEAPLPDQSRKRTAALVLEVESEMALCRRLFRSAKELRVESALLHDERWRLVSAFQCSFVGQLQKYLEHLAVLNSCNPNIHPDSSVHTSANAWEAILRNSCGSQSCWRTESSLPQHRVPPIIIRSREKSFDLSSRVVRFVEMARSSIGFYSSHISSKEQAIDAISSCGSGNDSLVSDWTLFSVFIEEACEQLQNILGRMLMPCENNSGESASLVVDTIAAAELSVLLQYCYAAGAMLGLALRAGSPILLDLPLGMFSLLAGQSSKYLFSVCTDGGRDGESLANTSVNSSTPLRSGIKEHRFSSEGAALVALTMRTGITSLFPEAAFQLFDVPQLQSLFSGACEYSCITAAQLYRCTSYDDNLSMDDPHILFFWAVIYELSQEQLRLLIVKLLPKTLVANEGNASGFSEELDSRARHVWLDCFLNACSYLVSDMPMAFSLTIMSPTALAMLNPDNPASVTVFPEQNYSGSGPVVSKIALPRCSTLQAMHKLLHALLQN